MNEEMKKLEEAAKSNSSNLLLEARSSNYDFEATYNEFMRNLSFLKEFDVDKITFNFVSPEVFIRLQWVKNKRMVLAYRSVCMLYTLIILICSIRGFHHPSTPIQGWGVWLCNWNYLFLSIHHMLAYIFVLACYLHETKILPFSPSMYTLATVSPDVIISSGYKYEVNTWYFKLNWMLISISQQLSLLLPFIYFYSVLPSKAVDFIPIGDIHMNIIPPFLVLFEATISCVPVRLAHLLYAWHTLALFVIVSVLHWLIGDDRLPTYEAVLDWNQAIDSLIALMVIFLVVQPCIQLLHYGIFRLRCFLYLRFFVEKPSKPPSTAAVLLLPVLEFPV